MAETPWRVTADGERQWQGGDGNWYPNEIRATLAGTPVDPSLPPPSGQYPYERPGFSGMATASFVFAIVFWPLGIVFGHVARHRIKRTGERGGGLAIAGLIISYLWGAVVMVLIVAAVVANHTDNGSGFNNLGTLQASVQQQINAQIGDRSSAAYDPGAHVTSTICVRSAGTQYSCALKLSDGTSTSLSITVSSDGSRWVTN